MKQITFILLLTLIVIVSSCRKDTVAPPISPSQSEVLDSTNSELMQIHASGYCYIYIGDDVIYLNREDTTIIKRIKLNTHIKFKSLGYYQGQLSQVSYSTIYYKRFTNDVDYTMYEVKPKYATNASGDVIDSLEFDLMSLHDNINQYGK